MAPGEETGFIHGVKMSGGFTEERGGTAWAQALHDEEERIHPCRGVDVTCTVSESIGDMVVLDGAP